MKSMLTHQTIYFIKHLSLRSLAHLPIQNKIKIYINVRFFVEATRNTLHVRKN